MQVTISCPRKGRLRVVGRRAGAEVVRELITPDVKDQRERAARLTGVSDQQLLDAADRFDANRNADPVVIETPDAAAPPFKCLRRAKAASAGADYDSLDAAIAAGGTADDVIEWDSGRSVAVLDIDYHGTVPPAADALRHTVARVRPQPGLWWRSRNGGAHLVYTAGGTFDAEELAACAGLAWLGVDPVATFEVLHRTAVPPGEVFRRVATADVAAVAGWLRESVTEEQVDEWLDDTGLRRGESYDHKYCPFNSGADSHGAPLFVGDGGLFCHKCESVGYRCGSRRPGFFPYAALLHGGTPSCVRIMGQNLTHFEHAKLVLADTVGVKGLVAELAYRSLLKLMHGADDQRVARVFTAGNNLVRLDNRWTTRDAIANYDKMIQPILAALPACQDAAGKPVAERVTRFTQNVDLGEYGYPAVTPIRGLRIFSHRNAFADPDRISVVVPSGVLRSANMDRFRPRYVPRDRRASDPWAVVERALPGVNREFVRLLIAAKGVAEGQVGLSPNILVCGPTAAGKSTMTTLAAAICGDHNTEVPWQSSVERFRQGVASGADAGTYVTVNEVFKDAGRHGKSALQALDVFLNLTPDSVSHKLYVGPVPLGRVPVCVVTDINVPQVLRNDTQLARRFVYVRLNESHGEWVDSIASTIGTVQRIRVAEQYPFAAACDAIVSEVIDEFFDTPRTLSSIAAKLGFSMLTDSTDFDDPKGELQRFFKAVCDAPELADKYRSRWPGRGWKLIQPGNETELAEAWEAVRDGSGDRDWFSSRRCDESDWKKLLRAGADIRFETRRHRYDALVVRFRSGRIDGSYRVNGEIKHVRDDEVVQGPAAVGCAV